MFLQIAVKRTTDWLMQGGSITEEDRKVYEFGLDKLFSMLINFGFVAGIGLLFGMFAQTFIFYIAYIGLRIYAGGYHADKPLRCFVMSISIIIPCLLLIRLPQMWNVPIVFYSLLGFGVIILALLGPVGNKNKVLDELEKVVYRRRLLRNLATVTTTAIILFVLTLYDYSAATLCGILLSAVAAIVGKVKFIVQMRNTVKS